MPRYCRAAAVRPPRPDPLLVTFPRPHLPAIGIRLASPAGGRDRGSSWPLACSAPAAAARVRPRWRCCPRCTPIAAARWPASPPAARAARSRSGAQARSAAPARGARHPHRGSRGPRSPPTRCRATVPSSTPPILPPTRRPVRRAYDAARARHRRPRGHAADPGADPARAAVGHRHERRGPRAPVRAAVLAAVADRVSRSSSAPSAPATAATTRPRGPARPLPRLDHWSIWNEPDEGFQLAPQTRPPYPGRAVGPPVPRAGRRRMERPARRPAMAGTRLLIGELAPGRADLPSDPGLFGSMAPLRFLRALYCVDADYKPLSGTAAAQRGCPTTAAASARFAAAAPRAVPGLAVSPTTPIRRAWPPTRSPPTSPITRSWRRPAGSSRRWTVLNAALRLLTRLRHLQHRVRLPDQAARHRERRRQPPDRGGLDELGRVHHLAGPAPGDV